MRVCVCTCDDKWENIEVAAFHDGNGVEEVL